jgi:hypothetical protein
MSLFDTYCNICQEDNTLVLATTEYCIQREDDPENKHYVRCCDRHKEQGKQMAEIMQHNISPAVVSCTTLDDRVQQQTTSGLQD